MQTGVLQKQWPSIVQLSKILFAAFHWCEAALYRLAAEKYAKSCSVLKRLRMTQEGNQPGIDRCKVSGPFPAAIRLWMLLCKKRYTAARLLLLLGAKRSSHRG
ncbi:hypothetical protein C7T94_08230 [Pedobacter yulinensis]|uniref:Uncharacterized protein n=1 Tax=Pedobacter yulinensis TaxID=2126353 RepID=A0A2T3HJM7_9SPHI|nr:hypothetical protein C7T94_08230 [Pedobacter yulinensis]